MSDVRGNRINLSEGVCVSFYFPSTTLCKYSKFKYIKKRKEDKIALCM